MKKLIMVLATTVICGACLFTSCKKDEDLKIEEKIIGKWILAESNGKPTLTNNKYVITFASPTKGYLSASLGAYTEFSAFWGDRQEVDVAITGNKVKNTIVINEHLTVIDDMTITNITDTDTWGDLKISWMVDGTEAKTVEESIRTVKVTDDYSQAVLGTWECLEITGGETNNDDNARLEFLADGTYNFYRLNDTGVWTLVPRERNEFFVDGILLCTRWQAAGEEKSYEWWEIASVAGSQMQWTALRQNADGTTFQQGVKWVKVN